MTLIADVFRKLRTPKKMVRSMPKKSFFRRPVEKQPGKCSQILFKFEGQLRSTPKKSLFRVSVEKKHGKGAQTLFKFEGQPLYHITLSLEVNCPIKGLY